MNMTNESQILKKGMNIFKVFNCPKDLNVLRDELKKVFNIHFLSVINHRSKEHFIVPSVYPNEDHQDIGVQHITKDHPLWPDVAKFFADAEALEAEDVEIALVKYF